MKAARDSHLEESSIREALYFVDASDRSTWLRMGMAIKSELNENGFDLWNDWSQQADSYDEKSATAVWKSLKPDGAITINSLFFEARKSGYSKSSKTNSPIRSLANYHDLSSSQRSLPPSTNLQIRTAENAKIIWDKALVARADHPYLARKQVSPTPTIREIDVAKVSNILGYRPKSKGKQLQGRLLVVPVMREDQICTLELIDETGAKSALPGLGTKTGGYWSSEALPGLPIGLTDLLIGEGVATVLSASESTGFLGVAALTAVNLGNVAREMRRLYPDTKLIVLADLQKKSRLPDPQAQRAATDWNGYLAIPDFEETQSEELTDFNDMFVVSGKEAVANAIHSAKQVEQDGVDASVDLRSTSKSDDEEEKRPSQASLIVDFAKGSSELFHDGNREVYAKENTSGEVRHLGSRSFRDWLVSNFYESYGVVPRDQSVKEAIGTLSGLGRFRGDCRNVYVRVAKSENAYYLDLAQPGNNSAVRISEEGWEVVSDSPVDFVRYESMQPLPTPRRGGDINDLWKIANIPEQSRLLVLAWLCECLRPETPFPLLELVGEQGSAKSTTQEALRRIIDPNACDLRGAPKVVEDIFVSAGVTWLVSYENISYLSSQMQDALCILSTGGGFAKRRLYSDADETVISVKRPVVINGISVAITAQDLVDRAVSIEMPVIMERQHSGSLWGAFNDSRDSLLGALLDLMSEALKHLPGVELKSSERPRLIEFASLGAAIAVAQGLSVQDFMMQFNASREEAIARTIDASPVATAMIEWYELQHSKHITKTVKSLFSDLERHKPIGTDAWPRSAKGFGDALRRSAPALRAYGIECRSLGKVGGNVQWEITPTKKSLNPSPGSPGSPAFSDDVPW